MEASPVRNPMTDPICINYFHFMRSYDPIVCCGCDVVVAFRNHNNGHFICEPECFEANKDKVAKLMAGPAPALQNSNRASPVSMAEDVVAEPEPRVSKKRGGKHNPDGTLITPSKSLPDARAVDVAKPESIPAKPEGPLPETERRPPRPKTIDPATITATKDSAAGQIQTQDRKPTHHLAWMTPSLDPEERRPPKPAEAERGPNAIKPAQPSGEIPGAATKPRGGSELVKEANVLPPVNPTRRSKRPSRRPDAPAVKYTWFDCRFSKNLVSGADVRVCFMYGATRYQVQAVEDQLPLRDYLAKTRKYAEHSTPLTRAPVKDEILIGYDGEEFYRGRVLKVLADGSSCRLFFIDYGNFQDINIARLFEPNDELMEYPVYSVAVVLSDVPEPDKTSKVARSPGLINRAFTVLTLDLEEGEEPLLPRGEMELLCKLWTSENLTLNEHIIGLMERF